MGQKKKKNTIGEERLDERKSKMIEKGSNTQFEM
jgi:hypothetical protein